MRRLALPRQRLDSHAESGARRQSPICGKWCGDFLLAVHYYQFAFPSLARVVADGLFKWVLVPLQNINRTSPYL
jgi:hypothetical protein